MGGEVCPEALSDKEEVGFGSVVVRLGPQPVLPATGSPPSNAQEITRTEYSEATGVYSTLNGLIHVINDLGDVLDPVLAAVQPADEMVPTYTAVGEYDTAQDPPQPSSGLPIISGQGSRPKSRRKVGPRSTSEGSPAASGRLQTRMPGTSSAAMQ